MSLIGEQVLLRVYLRGADRAPHIPTHERIIHAARQRKMAGATVLRGIGGFGHRGVATESAWSLGKHEPVIVEIVDSAEKIAAFVEGALREVMIGGLITLERAAVLMYRRRSPEKSAKMQVASALVPLSTVPRMEGGADMTTNSEGMLLRIFIGDSDRFENQPLHEALVAKARELGLAGATVLRGTEGYGANSVVHKSSLLEMSSDLPVVIEMVDDESKIKSLLPHLESMVKEGMITMEQVMICSYRANASGAKL